jgi:hypothetical protein
MFPVFVFHKKCWECVLLRCSCIWNVF